MFVQLSNGASAVIDDADVELVAPFRWHPHNKGYVVGSGGRPLMHRLITGAPRGVPVDHRDGNKLNNQRSNLRVATYSVNGHNRHAALRGNFQVAGLRGVRNGRTAVYIWVNGRNIYVGTYNNLREAVEARARAEMDSFGELAPHTRSWLRENGG